MREALLETAADVGAVCERIEGVVRGAGSGLPAALTNVLHEVGQPESMRALLRALLEDAAALEQTARRSFVHRNGFVKLRLNSSDAFALRLHVWTGDATVQPEGNVHDHRWSFASHMVCGHFRVKTYAMHDVGAHELYCYRYRRHPVEDTYRFEDAGRQRFVLTGDQIMQAGSTYYMEASVFHQLFFPPRVTTATLVATLPRSRDWCYSCSEQAREPDVAHEMEHLTPAQVREYAAYALRAVDGKG